MIAPRTTLQRWLLIIALTLFPGVLAQPSSVVAFHFPWDQGHDTFNPDDGDNDNDPGDDACPPNTCCRGTRSASPVEFATGNFTYDLRILRLKGLGPELDLTLTYNSRDDRRGAFGRGWVHQYDQRLVETTDGVSVFAICTKANGKRERFVRNTDGSYEPPVYLFQTLTKNTDGTFVLRDQHGTLRRFGADSRLAAIQDRNGNALSIFYDSAGFMTRITDAVGRSVILTKGSDGRVASVTDPAGRTLSFTYDASGNLIRLTDALSNVTGYQYDAKGNLAAIIDPRGNVLTRITYDSEARVLTHVDGQETWTYTYLPASRRTVKRDSQGNTWTIEYSDKGNVTRLIDPSGASEEYIYDSSLNVTEYRDKRGGVTRATYDSRGNRISTTDPMGGTRTATYGSAFNEILTQTDARGNLEHFDYDVHGNLITITDALGNRTQLQYNARGQLVTLTDAKGRSTTFNYDANGNPNAIGDPLGNTNSAEFDILGKVIRTADAEGSTTEFVYDDAERLVRVINADGAEARFTYDASGNQTTVTDPNGATTVIHYDAFNRPTQLIDPLSRNTFLSYDRRNRLAQRVTPNGATINFAYDAEGRLVAKSRPEGTTTFAYDAVGAILSVINENSSLGFAYDALGRMTEARTAGTTSQPATTIRYSYDADGNRTSMQGPGGVSTLYAYDGLSRLIGITDHHQEVYQFAYDELSRRSRADRPLGISTVYAFDEVGRVSSLTHSGGPGSLPFVYSYDKVGNRIGTVDGTGTSAYTYNALYAVTAATYSTSQPGEMYEYDALGNRVTSHLSSQYSSDAANQLLSDDVHDYSYDANGNLSEKGIRATGETTRYHYDSENQLTRIDLPDGTVASYGYDGLGRRIEKCISGQCTQYVYDDRDIVAEYVGFALSARYTHGPGEDEILSVDRGGNVSYYETDAIRSVVRVVSAGGVEAAVTYDSFGRIIAQSGDRRGPYAFQGREFDDESGLYYYRARYYDPQVGRFVNRDPIGIAGGLNPYAFARNNPVTLTDPDGLYPGEDIVEFFPDAFGADKDFWDNYTDMREANTRGADKYFHCKANCEAARRGPGGALESSLLSELRELFDEHVKGDPAEACNADRAANDHGRKEGQKDRGVDCSDACDGFRPNGLDPKY